MDGALRAISQVSVMGTCPGAHIGLLLHSRERKALIRELSDLSKGKYAMLKPSCPVEALQEKEHNLYEGQCCSC